MPDTNTDTDTPTLEEKLGALIDQRLEEATKGTADDSGSREVVPEGQRFADGGARDVDARVTQERIERPEVMAHNVVRMLHGKAVHDIDTARNAAEELVRGGHYGERFAQEHRGAGDYYSTLVDSDGAFLLPVEVVSEIETLMPTFGAAMNIADIRTRNQQTGEVRFPAGTGDIVFSSIAEGGEFATSKRAFEAVKLNPKKVGSLVPWTYEAQVEAGAEILQDVQRKAAEGLARKMDQDMLLADGTSTYNSIDGLLNRNIGQLTLASGATTPADIDADDFIDIINDVDEGARLANQPNQGLTFVLHPNMRQIIRKLKDDNGQYVFAYNEQIEVDTVAGIPIFYTAVLPEPTAGADTDFGLIGNFRYWKIARYGQMFSEELREGQIPDADTGDTINLASQDLKALRIKAFHDMGTNFPEAFAKFTTASS